MSPIRSCFPVAFGSTERSVHERRKSVLTCPRCTHADPIEGDWVWREHNEGTELRCPNCYELLTIRGDYAYTD